MAYRFTNTEKWNDTWFGELKPLVKLLFLYLCDQCDIAGFLEINIRKISFDLGISKQEVEGGLKGLESRLTYSKDEKYLFIRNFIKHQKNIPLNENNKAHSGIIKRLFENINTFEYQSINDFGIPIKESPNEGANKGLISHHGNGNGNGNGNKEGGVGETKNFEHPESVFENSFEIAKRLIETTYIGEVGMITGCSSEAVIIKEMDAFCNELKARTELVKTEKDFRKHFLNWLKLKKEKALKQTQKTDNDSKQYKNLCK